MLVAEIFLEHNVEKKERGVQIGSIDSAQPNWPQGADTRGDKAREGDNVLAKLQVEYFLFSHHYQGSVDFN